MCLAFSCAVILSSCSTKQSAINELRNFATEIDANGAQYNIDDWKMAAVRYETIEQKLSKHEYTPEEKTEISNLKGKCVGSFARNAIKGAANKVKNTADAVKGFIEGIREAFGQ